MARVSQAPSLPFMSLMITFAYGLPMRLRLTPGPLATSSRQSPDTMCYGVSFTLSSLAFSVHLLLLPTGSGMRLCAAPSLRAPQRSRSSSLRGCLRSRIPMLPFSYVNALEHSQPSSLSGLSFALRLCGLFGSSSVTHLKAGCPRSCRFEPLGMVSRPIGRLH